MTNCFFTLFCSFLSSSSILSIILKSHDCLMAPLLIQCFSGSGSFSLTCSTSFSTVCSRASSQVIPVVPRNAGIRFQTEGTRLGMKTGLLGCFLTGGWVAFLVELVEDGLFIAPPDARFCHREQIMIERALISLLR